MNTLIGTLSGSTSLIGVNNRHKVFFTNNNKHGGVLDGATRKGTLIAAAIHIA